MTNVIIPLTVDAIHQAIQSCCQRVDTESPWSFRAAKTMDFQQHHGGSAKSLDESLLFGFVASRKRSDGSDATCSLLTTFHTGYFTWTGRAICLDELGEGGEAEEKEDSSLHDELNFLRMQLLAAIAVELSCGRLVWRHYGPPLILPVKIKDKNTTTTRIEPETLPGWWTMYWDLESLKAFVGDQSPIISSEEKSHSIQDIFKSAIEHSPHEHENFRLRLATADDVNHIDRLVHGLAVFEKEPDAVHTTLDQFRVDGFEGLPLYHCILVDFNEKEGNTEKPAHTCAMAFCFMGYHLKHGRFLYLEDLFFEEAYRGMGGGTLIMQTLATVAQSLGCTKVVWQALDWNIPALDFYTKIGAKVQEGLAVSRFAGEKLQAFARQAPLAADGNVETS